MTNKTYIRNTVVLFAAMAVTKIVGAIFKIPLANILGGTGMGYFSTAYGLYSPVFAVTAAGIPTVMMRHTAQNIAAGRCKNALRSKRVALILFTLIGAVGTVVIWVLSSVFVEKISCSPQSRLSVLLIAPAVLFCCIASVYRGYYEGMSNVVPTAAANVTEAVSRAVAGLAAAYGVLFYARYCFENGMDFLGRHYNTYDEMYEAALPYAAAGAIAAVTFSEICGLVELIIHDRHTVCRTNYYTADNGITDSSAVIIRKLLCNIIPIAIFALVMNCFSFIDLITVTRTIDASINDHTEYYTRAFREVFESGTDITGFANFAYGSYTGIAMSLFMLIPSFAGMTEKTSVPDIASAWEKRDHDTLKEKTQLLFKASLLIGCPACFGAAAMAEPIMNMLYSDRQAEINVCLNSFVILCAGGMFMVMTSAISSFFQAIGRPTVPLWLMSAAVLLKAVLNPFLISVPELNITGAAISTAICYFFACCAGLILVIKTVNGIRLMGVMIKIFCSAIGCAVAARCLYSVLVIVFAEPFVTLVSVFSGGIVYVLLLITMGVFRTSPIIKFEKKKKTGKGLEKSLKIG